MKFTRPRTLTALALVFVVTFAYSTGINSTTITELEKINRRIGQFYVSKNSDSLAALYQDHLTFFPEYKPAIFDVPTLRRFYTDWFRLVAVKEYRKTTYKSEEVSNHLIEVGTFYLKYANAGTEHVYKGNYMVMWERDSHGTLRILSEIFGADENIDPANMPYAKVQVTERKMKATATSELITEVEARNAEVISAVVRGDGEARADGFLPDGIYNPHFDKILDGMAVIRPYMVKTYRPGGSIRVTHTYYRIYDFGIFVFVNGHFKVGWGDAVRGGSFQGNMFNFMKRNESGKLLMYRQQANNDREAERK